MSERWTPPDEAARVRIQSDLDTNLLVEAGAGSGKTTAMVGRMIELIRTGTATMDRIAAVTFTRKAAAELHERFQERLEAEFRRLQEDSQPGDGGLARERIGAALRDLDRCFVGTIHSFCARLLRERPLEAGVPPNFQEVSGPDEERLRREAWAAFQDRLAARPVSRLLDRMARVALRPAQLRGLFHEISENPDVHFPAPTVPPPPPEAIAEVRARLGELLDGSLELLPTEEPADGWDPLMTKLRSLQFSRSYPGWADDIRFLDVLGGAFGRNSITQKRWSGDPAVRQRAKDLCTRWEEFEEEGSPANLLRAHWLGYRYPVAIRFARAAAGVYAADRLRSGQLTFQDLLLLTARLLRHNPEVRRELGERYRFLLVDEFQDTDPLQAEVVFLLGSDPSTGARWERVDPRPGALFVVGDPKQSIYRFRRADIALYGMVKRRFRQIGDVVELVANFRSTRPIERLVNGVFESLLPAEETHHQAAYAPLAVAPGDRDQQGVFWYSFPPDGGKGDFRGRRVNDPDSQLLASWIAERIERGERRPGDFMILTRRRKVLATYARALEARNIPVQVSGAGIGVEEELSDLVLLLQALGDPGNGVLTLAVLEGLFFGLSHEALYEHVTLGGNFSYLNSGQPERSAVTPALLRMREYRAWSQGAPADVVVPRIVEDLGILPYAAAGDLGSTRAGALLFALDSLRRAGLDGATSLVEAVEVLEAALEDDDAEAPLFAGEGDAVRIMNLHKAKGLEAPVVILANPSSLDEHAVRRHITRGSGGRALGYLRVEESVGFGGRTVARPIDWEIHEREEAPFAAAEEVRLLYVAATRARDELVVARCSRTEDRAFCTPLHAALDAPGGGTKIELTVLPAIERERLPDIVGTEITMAGEALAQRRSGLSQPSYRSDPVGRLAKDGDFVARGPAAEGARGMSWGRAVHRALELAASGMPEAALEVAAAEILREEGRIDAGGEVSEVGELVGVAVGMRASELWRRAEAAVHRHLEVPFMVAFEGDDLGRLRDTLELPEDGPPRWLVEGVIDLAFFEEGRGWVIADYKTDLFASDEVRLERLRIYRRQVELYALCWARITGQPVVERHIHFTQSGEAVVW